jgi:hypothetical protein
MVPEGPFMAVDDSSWGPHQGSGMKMMDSVVRRLSVKYENGSIDLIEIDGIFYLESQKSVQSTFVNGQIVDWLNWIRSSEH